MLTHEHSHMPTHTCLHAAPEDIGSVDCRVFSASASYDNEMSRRPEKENGVSPGTLPDSSSSVCVYRVQTPRRFFAMLFYLLGPDATPSARANAAAFSGCSHIGVRSPSAAVRHRPARSGQMWSDMERGEDSFRARIQ